MKFYLAVLAWLMIAIVLGVALFAAVVKGVWLALVAAIVAFVIAVGKIGCSTH